MLYTSALEETVEFYTSMFGFKCENLDKASGWASVSKDDLQIMFALPNEHLPFEKATFTGSLYFKTDDVETMWEQLKDKVSVCYPLETFDYGMKEFAVYDNNGYMIQFGQETE